MAESSYSLRANALRKLLKRSTSVKTVRLCLRFGSDRAWVSRSAEGLLVLEP